MSKEVFRFEKSAQDRLAEYSKILKRRNVLPASEVRNEWIYYLENILEPVGWKAVWQLSREECDLLEVVFPSNALVMVESTNLNDLSAVINIIAMQESGDFSMSHEIPLVRLYPTLQQENILVNMEHTANALDQLRFFYNYLWMPWDIEDDETQDWPSAHLEGRIILSTDESRKLIFEALGFDTCKLLEESREIWRYINGIETVMTSDDDDYEDSNNLLDLVQMHMKLDAIKKKFELLEGPFGRKILYQMIRRKKSPTVNTNKKICVVLLDGPMSDLVNVMNHAERYAGNNVTTKMCTSFHQAVEKSLELEKIILGPGKHILKEPERLENSVIVTGLPDFSETCLSTSCFGMSLLTCLGHITLDSVTLDASLVNVALYARANTKLINCRVVGKNCSATGIVVCRGSMFEASHSEFVHLSTGLVVNCDSFVQLNNCKIEFCKIGIQVYDHPHIYLKSSRISSCSGYGIQVETSEASGEPVIGVTSLLNSVVSKIQLENSFVMGSGNADVRLIPVDYMEEPSWSENCI